MYERVIFLFATVILERTRELPNRFFSSGKSITFYATAVRSPPLLVQKDGDNYEIDDNEFSALITEFLF